MQINLIWAHDINGVVGSTVTNDMPWPKFPADLKRFRDITMGHAVIMGRNTWNSLPGKLPGRTNIVVRCHQVPNNPELIDGLVGGLSNALNFAEDKGHEQAFIIGGPRLWAEALKYLQLDTIYYTIVQGAYDGDIKLPVPEIQAWGAKHSAQTKIDEKVGGKNGMYLDGWFGRIVHAHSTVI